MIYINPSSVDVLTLSIKMKQHIYRSCMQSGHYYGPVPKKNYHSNLGRLTTRPLHNDTTKSDHQTHSAH